MIDVITFSGSILVIMHSAEEPNSFFGGMAALEWNSEGKHIEDPANECSWLFKLETGENKYFNLLIIIKELIFISGNALTKSKLFMDVKVYFLILKVKIFKIVDLVLEFFF